MGRLQDKSYIPASFEFQMLPGDMQDAMLMLIPPKALEPLTPSPLLNQQHIQLPKTRGKHVGCLQRHLSEVGSCVRVLWAKESSQSF